MSVFSGIGEMTTANKSAYLTAGDYVASIVAVRLVNSKKSNALRDINGFLRAATGAEDRVIDAKFVEDVIADDGLKLVGMVVLINVHEKPTKNGGVFSKHTFRAPIGGDDIPF